MEKKFVKERVVITSNYDVEVESAIKEEIQKAVLLATDECSKKYMRNVKVVLTLEVR